MAISASDEYAGHGSTILGKWVAQLTRQENFIALCLMNGSNAMPAAIAARFHRGGRGCAKVRFDDGGTLEVPAGYVGALRRDPVEKKRFFHALPGSFADTSRPPVTDC